MSLRRVTATRFLNSLMEGGSRPALIKADDGGLYVAKLRGAAQGLPPLVAEIIVGELARRLGLHVPEIVLVDVPGDFGVGEQDAELRDLLRWCAGCNVGLGFIPEAVMFDPASVVLFDTLVASTIVWLDALTLNIDRTATNPNLLQRGSETILIDHGAALYFHFSWGTFEGKSRLPFEAIARHVLLPWARELDAAANTARELLVPEVIREVVDLVPDDLFSEQEDGSTPAGERMRYASFLMDRLAASDIFEQEARRAHESL